MSWTTLCDLDELTESKGKYVEIGGFQLAVFLDAGAVHVIDNHCPHAGGNLAAGWIEDGCAVCPLHQWAFKFSDGQLRDSPGFEVHVYPTRLRDHDGRCLVQADLPAY